MSAILRLELSIITANREILTPRAGMKHELPAGVVKSPLQNQKNTGALAIFCFSASDNLKDCDLVEVWVCSSIDEEDLVETIIERYFPGPHYRAYRHNFSAVSLSMIQTGNLGIMKYPSTGKSHSLVEVRSLNTYQKYLNLRVKP